GARTVREAPVGRQSADGPGCRTDPRCRKGMPDVKRRSPGDRPNWSRNRRARPGDPDGLDREEGDYAASLPAAGPTSAASAASAAAASAIFGNELRLNWVSSCSI